MRPRTPRPFRISDGLVLVAATGLGLAGCRFLFSLRDLVWGDLWKTSNSSAYTTVLAIAIGTAPLVSVLLACLTLAVLVLRLAPPRPRRGRLWRQPGFLACVAVAFTLGWKLAGLLVLIVAELATSRTPGLPPPGQLLGELMAILLVPRGNIGGSVLLVWSIAWASGRCRPEPSWVDRAGRVLGAAWVGITLLGVLGGVFW
jgi:hypothetical protein